MTSLFRDLSIQDEFSFDSEDVEQDDFWTETRIKSLRRNIKQGFSTADIAKFWHVASSVVRQKREELGLSTKTETKTRDCLVCSKPFPSWGAGNRQCDKCRNTCHWPFD